MLCVISPAKSMNESVTFPQVLKPSSPALWDSAQTLAKDAKKLTNQDIQDLMHVSEKIASLNTGRFANFPKTLSDENAKPAMYLFTGDVYSGFDVHSLNDADLPALQQRVRILSGLYGVLRPFDLTYPYRLEMGIKFANAKGANLYQFWGSTIAKTLNEHAKETGSEVLINLASNEYAKAIDRKALALREVVVQFKEQKGNQLKTIGLMAKRARGMMARFIVEEKPKTPKDLQDFTSGGYRFDDTLSSENELLFVRREQA